MSNQSNTSRRKFLFALGAGSAGAAAVVVSVSQSLPQVKKEEATQAAQSASGYKVTEHVKQYYKTTRI